MTHVLVIEDNDEVRREIVESLGFEGYRVRAATNGREGLECLERDPPALVLCDPMMPEMDGYLDARGAPRQPAVRDAALRHAHGAGMRINRITENALLYVQLELLRRGHGDVRGHGKVSVALAEIAERAARTKAERHGREADLVLDLAPATIAVAESYVVKVVEELVDNAFKFSSPSSPVHVATSASGERALLRIVDRGCGMTADQAKAVATAVHFERLLRDQQGLGLGLSIAQRIVALGGGALDIDSRSGAGTTVSVLLPLAEPRAAGRTDGRAGAAPRNHLM